MSSPAATGRRRFGVDMFRSLRVRNYRLFISGQILTLTGKWMQRVAQDWLVLNLTHNSGVALGLVTALQFTPTILFGMWGGMLADRYDKRRLLVAAQLAIAVQALLLGLLDATGVVALWHVFVLAVALGVISALETPTRQSFVMEMVGPNELANAVSLNSATFNSARIVGPAVAGLMINWFGTAPVFFVNAIAPLAVIIGLASMRGSDLTPSTPVVRAKGQLREAVRYVATRSDLLVPMVLIFVVGTFGLNFQITLALMAKTVFDRGAGSYGLLSTMLAIGSLAGALLSTLRKRRPRQRELLLAAAGFGVGEMIVGVMPSYVSFAFLLLPAGAAALTFTVAANSSVQMGSDPTMRGRVMALYLLCFMGGTPVGAPVIGWLAEVLGARSSLIGGGLICVLAVGVIAAVLARRGGLSGRDLTAELRRLRVRFGERTAAEPVPVRSENALGGGRPAAR